jgi:hypothetical protein
MSEETKLSLRIPLDVVAQSMLFSFSDLKHIAFRRCVIAISFMLWLTGTHVLPLLITDYATLSQANGVWFTLGYKKRWFSPRFRYDQSPKRCRTNSLTSL